MGMNNTLTAQNRLLQQLVSFEKNNRQAVMNLDAVRYMVSIFALPPFGDPKFPFYSDGYLFRQ